MCFADDFSNGNEIHDPFFVAEPAGKQEGRFPAFGNGFFSKSPVNPMGRSEHLFFWYAEAGAGQLALVFRI